MGVYAFSPRVLRADRAGRATRLPRPGPALLDVGEDGARAAQRGRLLARHRSPRRLRDGDGGVRADAGPVPARRHLGVRLEGRDIVCVGTADWATELPINQHQLMGRLAARNRRPLRRVARPAPPQLASRDLRRIGRRLARGLRGVRPADGLHVLSPLVLPFHGSAAVRSLNRRLLRRQVGGRRGGWACAIRSSGRYAPQAEALIDVLDPELVVYHCVDDVAAQKGVDAESFRASEERFARRADLVLASAPALAERMRSLSEHVLYAPNVADTALFATALEPGPVDAALDSLAATRAWSSRARSSRPSSTSRLLAEVAGAAARVEHRPRRAARGGDPGGDLSASRQGAEHPFRRSPRRGRPADRAARRRRRPDPLRDQRPDPQRLPDEGLRVSGGRFAGLATPLPALEGVEGVDVVRDADELALAVERELAVDSPQRRARALRSRCRALLGGAHRADRNGARA